MTTIEVVARAEVRGGASNTSELVVQYQVHNPLALPVLVFDRRWDADRDALDEAWMDVLFDGDRVLLMRGYQSPPDGVMSEEAPVPYGRRLDPGETHTTELTMPLPLAERWPWLSLHREPLAPGEPHEVMLPRVELHLGWCVLQRADGLPDASRTPQEIDGERLHWLDGALIAGAQQTTAAALPMGALPGVRFAGGVR